MALWLFFLSRKAACCTFSYSTKHLLPGKEWMFALGISIHLLNNWRRRLKKRKKPILFAHSFHKSSLSKYCSSVIQNFIKGNCCNCLSMLDLVLLKCLQVSNKHWSFLPSPISSLSYFLQNNAMLKSNPQSSWRRPLKVRDGNMHLYLIMNSLSWVFLLFSQVSNELWSCSFPDCWEFLW